MRASRVLCVFLAAFVLLLAAACSEGPDHRVIVVAIDGLDHGLTRQWVDQGHMPNFAALEREGGFTRLGTSIPPESPVAWSNFITGQNPGGHGIFDFLHHRWEKSGPSGGYRLVPLDPVTETEPVGSSLRLLGYEFPLSGGGQINNRKGTAFWEVLEDHGVPATIFKIPAHFPPTPTGQKTFSGMGTPDLKGGYGTYFLYTEDPFSIPGKVRKGELITVSIYENKFQDYMYGPVNTSVALDEGEEPPVSKVPFRVYLDPEKPLVKIEVGDEGEDARALVLREGEWSDYVEADFEIIPGLVSVSGIVRFHLSEVRPNFRLFVDPINIDPAAPSIDVSTPSGWASDLAYRYGLFETKGMPENTAALKDGVLTYDEYRDHSLLIYEKRKEMLFDLLDEQEDGVLFYYFCSIDLDQHMFWRLMDERHPSHDPDASDRNKTFIKWLYADIDAVVGEVRGKLRDGDTLVVMSDHGFAPYYRSYNLNTWLLENGYIRLKEEASAMPREMLDFSSVDWPRTRAFSLGFASIYLNVKGRDPEGAVEPGEAGALVDEICGRLMTERDPASGEAVFLTMYKTRDVYSGGAVADAPEIVVGFRSGYGASDASALGEFSRDVVEDNMSPWSGSHLMAAEEVPGVLLSNRKLFLEYPKLFDLTATILKEYGIEKTPKMIGRPIW